MCNGQWWICFYVYVKSGNWICRTKERSVLYNVGSPFGRGGLLQSVDSRLCWISGIVFDQGAVMPKLTPLTASNKCLRTIRLGFNLWQDRVNWREQGVHPKMFCHARNLWHTYGEMIRKLRKAPMLPPYQFAAFPEHNVLQHFMLC